MPTKEDNSNEFEGNEEEDNTIFCPFLKKDKQYENGTEFGILICKMIVTNKIDDDFRLANQEQILLLANRLGWSVTKLGGKKCKRGFFHIEMIDPSGNDEEE